jgi:hypothetical protein
VNPFLIPFEAKEIDPADNRLDFLEQYREAAFIPENLETLLEEAKIRFLGNALPPEQEGTRVTLILDRDPFQNHMLALARYNSSSNFPSPIGGTSLANVFDTPPSRLDHGAGVADGALVLFRPENRAPRRRLLEEPPSLLPQALPTEGSPIRFPKAEPVGPPAPFRKRGRGASGEPLTKTVLDSPEGKKARKDS